MSKKSKTARLLKRSIPLYLLLLPSVIYVFINNYIPMAGIIVAFKKYSAKKGIYGSPWNGLENFSYLFKTDAGLIIRNTLLYNVVFIAVNLVFAIFFAICISEVTGKLAKKVYQSAILLPFLVSMVIVSYVVYAFFSAENGMINNGLLKSLGKDPVMWYSYPQVWPLILVVVNLWKGVGYGCLIYIAGIAGIDRGYYESARLDGATHWQEVRYIPLPCLRPAIITMLLMSVGHIFNSDFGLFYQVPQNSGALYNVTTTIDTYVYRALTSAGGIGRSSAAGVFQSVVGFALVMICNSVVRRLSKDSALF